MPTLRNRRSKKSSSRKPVIRYNKSKGARKLARRKSTKSRGKKRKPRRSARTRRNQKGGRLPGSPEAKVAAQAVLDAEEGPNREAAMAELKAVLAEGPHPQETEDEQKTAAEEALKLAGEEREAERRRRRNEAEGGGDNNCYKLNVNKFKVVREDGREPEVRIVGGANDNQKFTSDHVDVEVC